MMVLEKGTYKLNLTYLIEYSLYLHCANIYAVSILFCSKDLLNKVS